ncbi:7-deoxyloganetin glucosyltransferase [Quercus suber]|uniref:7-deoxyloganetin glucosyltransferase n=1 Tax=Quercus suber TaxID=58331 RepID=A0AAW0LHB5_QUESU
MLKLAKLLHRKGFNISTNVYSGLDSRGPNSLDGLPDFHLETIPDGLPPVDEDPNSSTVRVSSNFCKYSISTNVYSGLDSRGPNSLDGLPDFHLETIPDGLPPVDEDVSQDMFALAASTTKACLVPLCNLISKLNDTSSSNVPPVTCIVADGAMSFTLDAADKFGIPCLLFWAPSACGLLSYMHFRHLVERGLIPLKDANYLTNGCLETTIDWIPGMKNVSLKDLPTFVRTTNENDVMLNFKIRETKRAPRALAIILNTFDPFKQHLLDTLSSMLSCIYTIGPLVLLANQVKDNSLKSIGSNLWKEESGCVGWLNSKESNLVVSVNYGSITIMTPHKLIEFAWGLANSEKPFLWIIRPDLVGGNSAIIPPEFCYQN